MPKMIDLGHIEPASTMEAPVRNNRKLRKEYPTVWIHHTDLPLSPTDVGKTFTITGTIHITGIEERVREDRQKRKEYNFELRSIAIDNSRSRLKAAVKKNART